MRLSLLLFAAAAGLLFQFLHLPAAWLFGPLVVAAFFATRGKEVALPPRKVYILAQACIGTALGAGLSPTTLRAIPGHGLEIFVAAVSILLTSILNGWILVRWTGLEAPTAFLGTLPGGAGEMAAMSDSLKADTRLVVIIQYARLLIILGSLLLVSSLLFHAHALPKAAHRSFPLPNWHQVGLLSLIVAAGFIAGTYTPIPAGSFLVPTLIYMVLILSGITPGRWPTPVFSLAYILMGLRIGSRFDPHTLKAIRLLFIPVICTTCVLLIGSVALGWWLSWKLHLDPASAYLAATPGGLDSVAAVAADLHADTGAILAIHMARLLSILVIGPWMVRFCASRMRRTEGIAPNSEPG